MTIRTGHSRRRRSGFSLTEVLVSMTLLSIILMSMARVTFQMSNAGRTNDMYAKRQAVLIQEANKFFAMSFDSLANLNVSDKTYTFGDFKFTRRLSITTVNSTHKTITIVIVPWIAGVATTAKKDSVMVSRTKPAGSPLCTTC